MTEVLESRYPTYERTRSEALAQCEEIAQRHGFTLDRIRQPGRRWPECAARIECYRLLSGRNWSMTRIAALFNRDHSTIVWRTRVGGTRDRIVKRAKGGRTP